MIPARLRLAFVLVLASPAALADDTLARSFCDAPPHDEVCPVAPKDNTDFDASFVMHRTESGNGGDWIWSTFEHVNAAPVADNSLDPNNILGELFADGCRADTAESRRYVLFDPNCKGCATNTILPAEWKWFEDSPHARSHAVRGEFGTQVVRCWKIFESTANVNALWHARLRDTVWSNYQLISTQWRGSPGSKLFPNGEVPRFLTNVTLETYDQYSHGGTCMGCHARAVTAAGQDANFSFLLSKAR